MKQKRRLALQITGIAFVALALGIFAAEIARLRTSQNFTTKHAILKLLSKDDQGFESSALIDSIISIVQAYYVDAERIDNPTILEKTIDGLGDYPHIHLEKSDDAFTIHIGEQHYIIERDESLSYENLIEELYSLGVFVEMHRPKPDEMSKNEEWYNRGDVLVLNSLLTSLDAHSNLMSEDNYRELKQGTEGEFGGIGVVVSMKDGILTVTKPIAKSPAFRGGLKQGDRIISINGTITYGYNLDQLVDLMRGYPGSPVNIGILSPGKRKLQNIVLERELITVDSLTKNMISHANRNFLHLMIESFSSRTAEEVAIALAHHRRQHHGHIDGVVLDLRSNPGGLLDQAVEVANIFIDKGVLVSTKGRREEVEASHDGPKERNFPMVVLINEESASASEIVAGALQDHQRAVIVGQPSFGKGSVQTIFELPGMQALKLTIARYYTPSGKSIQNLGIIPDVWLQPLFEKNQNINLLGSNRYRSERFLKNSLESGQESPNLSAKLLPQSMKAYVKKPISTDELETNLTSKDDINLKVASTILAETRSVYPGNIDAGTNRSGHWLAVASTAVQNLIDDLDKQTAEWLMRSQFIRWQKNQSLVRDEDLAIELVRSGNLEAIQGEEIEIPWKISNRSSKTIHRVSVYATSVLGSFEPTEILVGEVADNGDRKGLLKLKVPTTSSTTPAVVRVGAAVDALASSRAFEDLTIIAKPRSTSKIIADWQFIDGKNSQKADQLEPLETATIRIHLHNRSIVPTRQASLRLFNFNGDQVVVSHTKIDLGIVDQDEQRTIDFTIKGEKDLDPSSDLQFGYEIISADLDAPIRRAFQTRMAH